MGSELLRRVRWRNVSRAGVVVVVVAAVVAWPRLGTPAPRVPEDGARPLAGAGAREEEAPYEAAPGGAPERPARNVQPGGVKRRHEASRRERRGGAARRAKRRPKRRRWAARDETSRRVHPGIEGGGAGGPVAGGGISGPVVDGMPRGGGVVGGGGTGGADVAPPAASHPAPARDPAETEFGFER
jgi:hypothetical protein